MDQREKAVALLSRAEISLAGAEETLEDKNLKELKGQLASVNSILNRIRKESVDGFQG